MIEKNELRPVLVRIEEAKYRALRHALIDRGETFNSLVNKLLDEHMNADFAGRTAEASS